MLAHGVARLDVTTRNLGEKSAHGRADVAITGVVREEPYGECTLASRLRQLLCEE